MYRLKTLKMSLTLFGVISIILLKHIADASMQPVGQSEVFLTYQANQPLTLNCTITGQPQPTYTWSKQGSCGRSLNVTGSKVHVTDYLTIGDAGIYVCNASSGGNVVTQIYHVAVYRSGFEDKCNFENNNLCSWRQDSNDVFNWTFQSGNTNSSGTGPPGDHTTHGGAGKYIYIEASDPRTRGNNAAIVSHPLPANQPTCLSFFYNMFGADIGNLNVTIVDKCSGQTQMVFHESGNKGEAWKEATVSIPASAVPNEYEIKIGASVGSSFKGDIALDDILIQDTSCADPSVSILGNQMVNENRSLTLSCQLSTCSTSACTYSWTSSQAIPGNRTQQTMTLTNIKRDWNAATLYCRVTVNVSVSIVGSTTINVQYGPSTATISVSSPMKLTENTSPPTAITCSSPVCNPSCNAKWINGSTQIHNNTLFITPVSRYLAGSYKCNVSNSVGFWTKQLEIIVNYAPDVTLNWDESSKKLTCTVAGNPDNYTFHALEHRILGSTIRNISFQPGSGRSRYALLSYQDKGSYTCTVENGILKNGATKQSRTLEVVIKDVPVLLEHTRTYNVSKGDPLIVTIPIYAFPAVSKTGIMIKIGDRTMSTSDNITFNIKHHTGFVVFHNKSIESIQTLSLVINATQEEYFRNFTVNFTNSVGTTTAYFEIIPQGPPEIPVRFEQQSTTYQSVSFAVESGFFNGGDQTLVIEYRRVNSNTLRVNGSEAYVGNGKNVFVAMTVGDLTQMTDYEFRVYAFNVYGQSEYSAVVQVATALNVLMVVGIAGGTAGSICLIVLVVCLKKKRDKKKQ
ncbi:hemicentin-1-like [Dreissena polymorpha]|uniref:hemicentin-1-like n=1 Tax=Dreissena polymorpha TaxID=45954 RepID=UPI00226542C7|nr:hemicentin-1-like [Dreissena polymorpha]